MYILLFFVPYFKMPVTTMNDTDDNFFLLLFIRKTLMFFSSRK